MDLFFFCAELQQGKLDQQILELEQLANEQLAFTSPLKPKLQADQHLIGRHNMATVVKLREVKQQLQSLANPPKSIRMADGKVRRVRNA
jgi:hypothetical protein